MHTLSKPALIISFVVAMMLSACAPTVPQAPTATIAPTVISSPTVTVATAITVAPPKTLVPRASKPLNLLASTVLLQDALLALTQGIQGVTISGLVPIGADPHEYEPTPSDVKKIQTANAFFVIGANFEDEWLSKALKSANSQLKPIDASLNIPLNKIDESFGSEFENDPHYWLDPDRWQKASAALANAIVDLDPSLNEAVMTNLARYIKQIIEADLQAKALLAEVTPSQRKLVTTHDAMGYWAAHYGFRVIGAVIPGPTTTEGATNPRNIKLLSDKIKAEGVKAIFVETGVNPKLTEAVAKEAKITIVDALFLDTLSDDKGPAATYPNMLLHNARVIAAALK
jgi:ABC-type Zn uptake system ZnuABC Zn-binding protein ZnuA